MITDHSAIIWLQTKSKEETKARLIRWMLELSQFDMKLVWKQNQEQHG